MLTTLPTPDTAALAHSDHLRQVICDEIDKKGPMTFARYMELALYAPLLGYYRNGSQKFGAQGDFITAPEVSPLFAGCLANFIKAQFAEVDHQLFEIGCGSGALAVDVLLALEKLNALPDKYFLLELSSELQARQRETIAAKAPHLFDRCEWLTTWPLEKFNGVVFANELFDAMPVHQFVIEDDIQELFVTHHQQQLQWLKAKPSTPILTEQLNSYDIQFANAYQSEINLMIKPWLKGLTECLGQARLLFIDYGYKREQYYHANRYRGTLMCHFQHRVHEDPLLYPGIQDITAHVDFTLIAETAVELGMEIIGFQTQAQFLIDNDIMDAVLESGDTQAAKMLLLPSGMGEQFKILRVSCGDSRY